MSGQRLAIVGSGISGLTCAHLLSRKHEVTVFEANDYIGGHTHTVPVHDNGRELYVDTGFIVCNDRNYPNFLPFMEQLGVQLQKTEMSFSVRNPARRLEYNGHNLNTLFAQRRNFFKPSFYRLVGDILSFNKAARAALANGSVQAQTLDSFVARQNLSPQFRDSYLLPMVAAIWSCSVDQAGAFPLQFFLRFFMNHGLLDIKNRPQWYVLKGGSHSYIKPMTAPFADRIRLSSPVRSVQRHQDSVQLSYDQNGDQHTEQFDQVIFACHSDQTLNILSQPSDTESELLGSLGYQENDVILHSDASIMPNRPRAWASWNFLSGENAERDAPIVTYCMNILQGFATQTPMLVSLNARHLIDPAKIHGEYNYAHPVYSLESMAAQSRRAEICGVDRIHYCGAYWYNGFHEDGVRSALDVCQRFGESL
jgi:predicted NAD/FAD-binding protein